MVKPLHFVGITCVCQRTQWRSIALFTWFRQEKARSGKTKEQGEKKKNEKERRETPLQTRSLGRKNKRVAENQRDTIYTYTYICICRKKETEGESMIRSQVCSACSRARLGIRESLRMAVKWARSVVWHWSAGYTQCV